MSWCSLVGKGKTNRIMNFQQLSLPVKSPANTLAWLRGDLIDLAAGGVRYHLDGTTTPSRLNWGGKFDQAIISPSGKYAVLCQRLGTKGLLLELTDGIPKLLKELNRSYYHAEVYEYPAAFAVVDGKDVLIHCPEDYCRLEIENITPSVLMPNSAPRNPADFFHSRLATSPDGKKLLSAGWVWHPFDTLAFYDLSSACKDSSMLDKIECSGLDGWGEVNSAAFIDDDHLIISENADSVRYGENSVGNTPGTIGLISLREGKLLSKCAHDPAAGIMMPLNKDYVVTFYQHPKVVHLPSGQIVASWPDIQSGVATSSIIHHHEPTPALALDPERRRFAIAQEKEIVVITFD